MRTRSAGRVIILGAFGLAALIAGVACEDKGSAGSNGLAGPTATATSASAAPAPTSAVITCSARLSRPGDTCQLTMMVTFSDGSTRDVTADAGWGYGNAVRVSRTGLVTAIAYGTGEIIHNVYRGLGPNPMLVRVVPEGSFIVTGRVAEGGFKVEDARVSARSDYVMPDVQQIGGVTGWMRGAALAQAYGVECSSHLFIEVSAHLLAVTPTAHYLEHLDIAGSLLAEPLLPARGMFEAPDRPGTGLAWDMAAVERYRAK